MRTVGIGESAIDVRISDLMTLTNPTVGLAAQIGQTDIRITAKATDDKAAIAMIKLVDDEIRKRLGDWIYGHGTQMIEEVVGEMLLQQEASLAIHEFGANNQLSKRIRVGLRNRQEALVVSDDKDGNTYSAEKLARALCDANNTTYGLVVRIKPVEEREASVKIELAVASEDECIFKEYEWSTERTDAATWITTHGLAMLWQVMKQHIANN